MVVEVIASDVARGIGSLVGAMLIPGVGLTLLIVGLVRRSRSRRPLPPPGFAGTQHPSGFGGAPGSAQVFPGQAPWGGPPGYPPPPVMGQPHPGYPPPPSGRSSGTVLIVIGSIVLVLGLVGVVGAATSKHSRQAGTGLEVKDCITTAEFDRHDLDAAAVDCSRTDAIFELATRGGGAHRCPDGKRGGSAYAALTDDDHTLCFLPNLRQGACYFADTSKNLITFVVCSDSTANIKVAKRIEAASGSCGPDQRQTTFATPPRTYCLAAPN